MNKNNLRIYKKFNARGVHSTLHLSNNDKDSIAYEFTLS